MSSRTRWRGNSLSGGEGEWTGFQDHRTGQDGVTGEPSGGHGKGRRTYFMLIHVIMHRQFDDLFWGVFDCAVNGSVIDMPNVACTALVILCAIIWSLNLKNRTM